MPNQPKTPTRTLRVDEERWTKAQAEAARRGETLSDAIRAFLDRYSKPRKPKGRVR